MAKIDTAQADRMRVFRFNPRQTSELGGKVQGRLSGYEVTARGL